MFCSFHEVHVFCFFMDYQHHETRSGEANCVASFRAVTDLRSSYRALLYEDHTFC